MNPTCAVEQHCLLKGILCPLRIKCKNPHKKKCKCIPRNETNNRKPSNTKFKEHI